MNGRIRPRFVAGAVVSVAMVMTLVPAEGMGAENGRSVFKPKVNMGRVLVAAQLDQYRIPAQYTTPGAVKSVKRVQRSLRRKGFTVAADGNFGAQTTSAYAAWQRRLGYSGLDASGMPGETSLRKLMRGHYRLRGVVRSGERRSYSDVTLNVRTIRMMKAAGSKVDCVLDVTKGSYTGPDDSSQATHAGGGAVDLSVRRICGKRPRRVVRAMRAVGFAAWFRNWPGNEHIHAVAISDPDMATEIAFPGWFDAREQIVAFAQKKDGLDGAVAGRMLRRLVTWEAYKASR